MKSIKLKEEHKSKLLEMCNELFPKYDVRLIKPLHSCPDTFFVQIGLKSSTRYDLETHWFEFCMTHLVEKIIATFIINKNGGKVYKRTLNDDLSEFYLNSLLFSRGYDKKHPIDYLYEEFKKLK